MEREKDKNRRTVISEKERKGLTSMLISVAAKGIKVNDFLSKEGCILEKDLKQIKSLASRLGLNEDFIRAMLHLVDNESIIKPKVGIPFNPEDRKKFYRRNLLELTRKTAYSYNEWYRAKAPFATDAYLRFEQEVLGSIANNLKSAEKQGVAVDLGCATGIVALMLARNFRIFSHIYGFDVSPIMIQVADGEKIKGANMTLCRNVSFANIDIEQQIPVEEKSASLVVMNLGTASDIHGIESLISRIRNILMKDGRFLISFYNAGALCCQLSIPWSLGLVAEIDPAEHCLNVHANGEDHLVYARPYTVREVKKLFQRYADLKISEIATYPTVASILPDEFFIEEKNKKTVEVIDRKLVGEEKGAYILVSGRKDS